MIRWPEHLFYEERLERVQIFQIQEDKAPSSPCCGLIIQTKGPQETREENL